MPNVQRTHGMRSSGRKVRNPGALAYWRRKQKLEANPDEMRVWMLSCAECEHFGSVHMSLRRLRAANLVCSECGALIRR